MATGTVSITPRRTLLWSTTTNIQAGDVINLTSSDYDFLEVVFSRATTTAAKNTPFIQRFSKGQNITLFCLNAAENDTTNTFIQSRLLTRNSDTKYTADAGVIARWGGTAGTGNFCMPWEIYGIKY